MKIDLEQLQAMKELLTHQRMGEVVPVHNNTQKDTFSIFTDGLRSNWIFVMALVAVGMWLINGSNEQRSVNAFQDVQLKTTVEDIAQANSDIDQNTKNIQTLNATQVTNYNDIVRRMDALQNAVDGLKSQ